MYEMILSTASPRSLSVDGFPIAPAPWAIALRTGMPAPLDEPPPPLMAALEDVSAGPRGWLRIP